MFKPAPVDVLFIHHEVSLLSLSALKARLLGQLDALHSHGVRVGLMILHGRSNFGKIRKAIPQRPFPIIPLPRFPRKFVKLNTWLIQFYLLVFFKNVKVIQFFHPMFSRELSPIFQKNKRLIVFDYDGVKAEEYKYVTANWDERRYRALQSLEDYAVFHSHKVVCVSNRFKQYLQEKYPRNSDRISVIPMGVDDRLFRYDPVVRNAQRQKLGLNGKIVFVYSGTLFKWQLPQKTFDVVRWARELNRNVFFLLLTNDLDQARMLIEEMEMSEFSLCVSLTGAEVPQYLIASDIGILLRENHIVNRVASPTKFAEYLSCGLKVITTPWVGDYSELVLQHELGIVLDNLDEKEKVLPALRKLLEQPISEEERQRISRFGIEHFRWSNLVNKQLIENFYHLENGSEWSS